MKLCDLDQRVIVPVVDETRGGMRYEVEMSVGELLERALEDFKPAVVDAVPVGWLQRRRDIYLKAYHAGHESEIHTAAILNDTLMAWQKEQGART
jgi:hypothetical protein